MKIDDFSPAYVAYKELGRLPKHAPKFDYVGGYPLVYHGEQYCRAIDSSTSSICGRVFSKRNTLLEHLERVHGERSEKRPAFQRLSKAEYRDLAETYDDLMEYETYDKKGLVEKPSRYAVPPEEIPSEEEDELGGEEPIHPGPAVIKQEHHHPDTPDQDPTEEQDDDENFVVTSTRRRRRRRPASDVSTSRGLGVDLALGSGSGTSLGQNEDDQDEEELQLELEKAEAEEDLQRAILRKIELKRKLALMRKRRAGRTADVGGGGSQRNTMLCIVGPRHPSNSTGHPCGIRRPAKWTQSLGVADDKL
ncbi:hypothetical protein PRZ48_013015 [Zasmidium cellare]|uniref:C2H2-type domain-containing protein n=1 Tax=Zasmidium cellare TaxID=395010 RepID=A0ABR0E2W2_ZASCE|nr:hypothetical protein PRZ48_013015 [Zasmidium cellare]